MNPLVPDADIVDDAPTMVPSIPSVTTAPPPARRPRRTESELTKLAIGWLNAQPGTYAWKLHTGAFGESGHPDIDGCVNGRSLKIEMKEPGLKPTVLQMARLQRWRAAGAMVGWATSLDHVQALHARAADPEWINPLTGPGDGDGSRKARG